MIYSEFIMFAQWYQYIKIPYINDNFRILIHEIKYRTCTACFELSIEPFRNCEHMVCDECMEITIGTCPICYILHREFDQKYQDIYLRSIMKIEDLMEDLITESVINQECPG